MERLGRRMMAHERMMFVGGRGLDPDLVIAAQPVEHDGQAGSVAVLENGIQVPLPGVSVDELRAAMREVFAARAAMWEERRAAQEARLREYGIELETEAERD